MDHTNFSRYQNPPQQEEYSRLSHLNSKEDYLDVFVVGVIHRSPIIYVLINITLLIWLAQTIISSRVQEVPRSAYLISPFFGALPFKQITITSDQKCQNSWQKVLLKTFPTVYSQSYTHKQMYRWPIDGNITFCIKRIQPQKSIFQYNGTCSKVLCSQYCFENQKDCPITSISIKDSKQIIGNNQNIFYTTKDGMTNFLYSRITGRPIVSLLATFHSRCANDYRYLDQYNKLNDYYKSIQNCGPQGNINTFYDQVIQTQTQDFMFINNRGRGTDIPQFRQIQLGVIRQIAFSNDNYGECILIREVAKKATQYLFNDPIEPLFTQSLLVIGFILMIAQIIWLLVWVCVSGYFQQKNIIVILICIIEQIVISFIYSQNSKLFDTQKVIQSIAKCIQTQIPAATTWNFGIQSSSSFIMIQYIGTIFLSLYLICYLMDKFMFSVSTEIYRNMQYDQSSQHDQQRYNELMQDQVIERNQTIEKNK